MKIELLNVRIQIQRNTVVVDKYGNHKNEWSPYYSCSATISSESPKEETDAGLIVDDSKIEDELYDILGVDHMNYKRKAVKLLCQKARRS